MALKATTRTAGGLSHNVTMRAATRMLTAVASVSHAVMCMRGTSIKGKGTRQWKPWR
jgi:hypothetical protein